ncbi:putative transposase Ptta/En/Spm plant [Arabidopsis suecica]|uniref:Putative transposase Ptta/En/Spm plant n=1 Tax=Arabidopsis suecica TaxID=45249 RepID=A0A8T2A294_ARASU|nr:putative transposase Ptta/En/Spm plant [Arabidopsis suecica]
MGQLSNDVHLLPINYTDWRLVSPHIKTRAWEVIQSKFRFDDPMMRKEYVMGALGSRCKDVKQRVWNDYKKSNLNETLQNRPDKIPEDQWSHLVHMRFTEKWKKMQERNTKNQKNNIMPHLCGRKSFSRKRDEIKTKIGKTPCRAEFFIETRKKQDGSFVCDAAKIRAEALTTLLSQNPQVTNNITASLDDEYSQVFGPERPGRVRCVGRGPTPSRLVKHSSASRRQETENSELVVQLKAQVKALGDQVNGMSKFFQQILGTSTREQASAWAINFAAAFANIPNPPFVNIPNPPNPQEKDNGASG